MDECERAAIRDEGYDPDDPAVIVALARVTVLLRSYRARPSKLLSRQALSIGGV